MNVIYLYRLNDMGGLDCEKKQITLFFVVMSKLSYLLWVSYYQPPENTLIKKDKEKLHIFLFVECW